MSKQGNEGLTEERWHGLGVSDGVAVGRVLRIHNGARFIYRATIEATDVERETERLQAAVRLAHAQLLTIKERAERELGSEHAYIFDAHLLMLEDRKLIDEFESYIRRERVNAEWAVKVAADRLLAIYSEIKDDYLRERGSDIEDVMHRVLVALKGGNPGSQRLTEDAIVVAEELLPSTAAELDFANVRAVVSDVGGWTSHTAIIARSLSIPSVVGVRDLFRRARTGDPVVVDAFKGEVVLHPSAATVKQFSAHVSRMKEASKNAPADDALSAPLRTLDGCEVTLRANIELPAEYEGIRRYGARGIGLYRSEFLLSHDGVLPSEEEQCAAYIEVAQLAGADGATIRLFDLGGEKIGLAEADAAPHNPALGLRAIRFALQQEDVLRTQVRALLRAAAHQSLRIVLPMISDVSEVRRTRAVINEERARLHSEGHQTGVVEIGAMIEVPSAVFVADKLAREVDFFSLGTNDLVQYLLAVDRSNDQVADWFRSLHPAVLQSIRLTLDAARRAEIPAVVCGEMAATPTYAFVLLGLGARDLSMSAAAIPRIRYTIARVDAASAERIVTECLECASADEVEEHIREQLGKGWPHLFSPESLPAPKNKE